MAMSRVKRFSVIPPELRWDIRSRSFSGHCDVVGSLQMKHCSTAVEVEKQGYTEIVELPKVDKGCFKVWVAQQ